MSQLHDTEAGINKVCGLSRTEIKDMPHLFM